MSATSRARFRGTTVIEVLVACSVLMMLLGALYLLMVGGMRYFMQGRAFQTVQQQSLVGLRNVLAELQDSRRDSFQYSAAPVPHIIFLSAARPYPNAGHVQQDASGAVNWQKWVCYRVSGAELQRDEWVGPGLPSTTPPALPGYAAFNFTGPEMKVIARNITELNCSDGPTVNSVFVEVVSSEATGSDKTTEMRLRSQVHMYNRF